MNRLEVSLLLREQHFEAAGNGLADLLERVAAAGLDGVAAGDHLVFQGSGSDGLISAAALLAAHPSLRVKTAIYLLPLRHPVVVARQLATLAEISPGRFTFGVGVGGEDPAEYAAAGVPHRERGARADEALALLEKLRTGAEVTHRGRFFDLDAVAIRPAIPDLRVLVGGRSDAALTRAARFGSGWIGVWVSVRRFAEATALVEEKAAAIWRTGVDWRHEHQGWCFFDRDAAAARRRAELVMGKSYGIPFESFERYTLCGTPEDVAGGLRPLLEAGCRSFNLVADGRGLDEVVEGAGRVREILVGWL